MIPAIHSLRPFVLLTCVFVGLIAGLVSCRGRVIGDSWEVVVSSIPEVIDVRNNAEGATLYVIGQTHEPLFRKEDGQNFTSKVLSHWSRSVDSAQYMFCPDTREVFDTQTRFTVNIFHDYLKTTVPKYDKHASVRCANKCCSVRFPYSRKGFLDFLTRYENAPSYRGADGVENGLGPYYVDRSSKSTMVLLRKHSVHNGYNRIILRTYKDVNDPVLQSHDISDFNLLPVSLKPAWIRKSFQSFSTIRPRSVALAINHSDEGFRKMLYNCLDVREFRRAFSPSVQDINDIKTVLPLGVPGATPGLPEQFCGRGLLRLGGRVVLANPVLDNNFQMQEFANGFYRKTGIKLEVLHFTAEQMRLMLHAPGKRKPYNLVVAVLESLRADYDTYLKYYIDGTWLIDFIPADLQLKYRRLMTMDDGDEKVRLAAEISRGLEEHFLVLPLYQTSTELYYPLHIKNISVGRGFTELPSVGDFRW